MNTVGRKGLRALSLYKLSIQIILHLNGCVILNLGMT